MKKKYDSPGRNVFLIIALLTPIISVLFNNIFGDARFFQLLHKKYWEMVVLFLVILIAGFFGDLVNKNQTADEKDKNEKFNSIDNWIFILPFGFISAELKYSTTIGNWLNELDFVSSTMQVFVAYSTAIFTSLIVLF